MESDPPLVEALFMRVGRFRRQLRRVAGDSFEDRRLSESQAELLRLISRLPGTSVSEAATELGLAPNTTSTLVTGLIAKDLLRKTPDPNDRRVGRLSLTPDTQQVADESRTRRHQVIADAVDDLTPEQQRTLQHGLDVLGTLTDILHEREGAS